MRVGLYLHLTLKMKSLCVSTILRFIHFYFILCYFITSTIYGNAVVCVPLYLFILLLSYEELFSI